MAKYEKPIVTIHNGEAEGIYMASGENSADCWTVDAYSVQDWNGSMHVFEVKLVHSAEVKHISDASTCLISFNNTITYAEVEANCTATVSGNQVSITRTLHANAYNSGDVATFKLWVKASDEATTKALAVTGKSMLSCDKRPNVQGGFD